MVTQTTNLSLNKPAVNSATDEDLWGDQLNTNMDTLDSQSVLKTVDLDFNDKVLSKAEVQDLSETTKNLGTISGALVIDYKDGHLQYATLNGNITSVTINNLPAVGKVGFLTLELTQDGTGSRTIALSSAYRTSGGASINLSTTSNAVDIIRFETRDGGTSINTFINSDMS